MKKLTQRNKHVFFYGTLKDGIFTHSNGIDYETIIKIGHKFGYVVKMLCNNKFTILGRQFGKKWKKQRKNDAIGRRMVGVWQ